MLPVGFSKNNARDFPIPPDAPTARSLTFSFSASGKECRRALQRLFELKINSDPPFSRSIISIKVFATFGNNRLYSAPENFQNFYF